jgi:hypothetical protein
MTYTSTFTVEELALNALCDGLPRTLTLPDGRKIENVTITGINIDLNDPEGQRYVSAMDPNTKVQYETPLGYGVIRW